MPTLQPCPSMLAATSEAARLACPTLALSECCTPPRPGHCAFRALLEHGDDPSRDGATARGRLGELERIGALIRDAEPRLLIYRHATQGVRTMGVVGACPAGELGLPGMAAPIAIPERADDDTSTESRYLDAVGAHLEPVTIAIPDCPDLESLLVRDTNERPRMHFVGPDRATHTIWTVHDSTALLQCVGRIRSATVVNNAQAACAAMRLATTMPGGGELEASRLLVLLLVERDVGRASVEVRIDGADSGELDRTTLARLLDARTEGAPDSPDPRNGTATLHGGDGDPISLHLPQHGRTHDLTHVDESLRRAGIRFRICPVTGPGQSAASASTSIASPEAASNGRPNCATSVGGRPAVRIRLHGLSLNDLRRAVESATQRGDGLPPHSCWLPPVPLSGLVLHPFR